MKSTILACLLLFTLFSGMVMSAQAQCVPNNDPVVGIEPDTLSVAYVGIPYEQIIYFKMPLDTSIQIGPITVPLIVDSLIITSYSGLPPSFALNCNNPSCTLLGGANGCAAITGTATPDEAGYHQLKVYVTTFVSDTFGTSIGGVPDSITFYFLDIQFATGIEEIGEGGWKLSSLFPNPANDQLTVAVTAPADAEVYLQLTDLYGRLVEQQKWNLKKGMNLQNIQSRNLPEGLYLLRVAGTGNVLNGKFHVIH